MVCTKHLLLVDPSTTFPSQQFHWLGFQLAEAKVKSHFVNREMCLCQLSKKTVPFFKVFSHLHLAVSHISFMVALQQTVSCPKLYTNSVYRGIQITLCIAQQQYNLQRLDLCQAKLGLCTPKDETELLTGCLNSVWPHGVVHVSLPSVLRFGTCLHFLARRHKGALDVVWR